MDAIFGALLDDPALLGQLFGFLDAPGPLDCARAGFFARAVTCLLMRRHADVMRHLQGAPAVLERLVAHVDTTSIAEARAPPAPSLFCSLYASERDLLQSLCDHHSVAMGSRDERGEGGWTRSVLVQQSVHCCGRQNRLAFAHKLLAACPVTPRHPRRGPAARTPARSWAARAQVTVRLVGADEQTAMYLSPAQFSWLSGTSVATVRAPAAHARLGSAAPLLWRLASYCVALSHKADPLSFRLELRSLRAA